MEQKNQALSAIEYPDYYIQGTPQHGDWHFMQQTTRYIDRERDVRACEDPLGLWYLTFNISHLDSPKHHNCNCTRVYACNTTDIM